jgi:hypothetical protein
MPEPRRWLRRAAGAAVAGGLLAWLAFQHDRPDSAPSAIVTPDSAAQSPPETVAAPDPTGVRAPAAAAPPAATGCGVKPGLIADAKDPNAPVEAPHQAAYESAIELRRVAVERLLASGDAREHAAGLFLDATSPLPGLFRCPDQDCSDAIKGHAAAQAAPIHQLASMARSGNAAEVYAWAVSACQWRVHETPPPTICSHLSNERWAQLAPDSVWPWLALAGVARRAGDVGAPRPRCCAWRKPATGTTPVPSCCGCWRSGCRPRRKAFPGSMR